MQTKNSPIFRFYLATFGGSFALFWALVSYSWGRNQVQKQFKTYLCGQLTLVFEVQPYVLFLIWSNLGPFCTFGAIRGYFWGWGQVQKLFWDILRKGFKKQKKKLVEYSTKGLTPPPPPLVEKILLTKNDLHAMKRILYDMGL